MERGWTGRSGEHPVRHGDEPEHAQAGRPREQTDAAGGERLHDAIGDDVDLAHAVDLNEQAALGVDVGQRRGGLGIDLEATADDGLGVVSASLLTGPLEQAGDDGLGVGGDLDDDVEGQARVLQHGFELTDLRGGAWVAVQEEAGPAVGLGDAVGDHGVGDGVGHVLALVHVGLGLGAELGGAGDVGAEDVSGGDGRDAEALSDPCGLGALARSGGTEKNHACAHDKNPS